MNSSNRIMKFGCLMAILTSSCFQFAWAEPRAKLEVLDPYESTFLSESLTLFVRITNTGDMPISIRVGQESELYFETDPHAPGSTEDQIPRSRFDFPTEKLKGFVLPAGRARVLSDLDYNEGDMMNPSVFVRVRAHFLIERGRWVASEWYERNIIPTPNLDIESLYDYRFAAGSGLLAVIPLSVGGETWLFLHPQGSGNVGRRLCRLPDGVKPSFIEHNQETRRLTILFGENEDPVVINTRTGMPVSGSEKTVPQLHFWKRIAGRPFSDFLQEMKDRKQGVTTTMDTIGITVPAILESGDTTRHLVTRSHPLDQSEPSYPHPSIPSQDDQTNRGGVPVWNAWSHWLFGIAGLLVIGTIFILVRSRKSGASS